MLSSQSYFQFTPDLLICRLLNGLWQVSGAHGAIDSRKAIPEMLDYHQDGFITWDLADHYGPAEEFIGQFRKALGDHFGVAALERSQAFTKWVPQPAPITPVMVENAINRSRQRMGVESLDLVQFHWWEYRFPGYLEALDQMNTLRKRGWIKHLALTNFDTSHLQEIVEHGIPIVSNQVQFSIIDRRPEALMIPYCQTQKITLLTYGTLCGGLLSERYWQASEPRPDQLNTASLRKYKNMIDAWGGWNLFQELLTVLKRLADRYGVSIANIATRYILDKPQVAGVIIGTRLGIQEHRQDNARVFSFTLSADDLAQIHQITAHSRDLMRRIGDCGDEYRR